MVLHILNSSAASCDTLIRCCQAICPGDSLLLLEDGVYAALQHTQDCDMLKALPGLECFVLREDLELRGLQQRIDNAFSVVSYDGFVELTENCESVLSWY